MVGTRVFMDDGTLSDGLPMIGCFNTCKDSIRTIPAIQHDPNKAEDLDTNSEDHCADEWRYMCMSRPLIAQKPQDNVIRPDRWDRAFDRETNDYDWATG